MNYKSVVFLLMFFSFVNITGCSDDPKDAQISLLEQQLRTSEKSNKELIEKIANLSEQVGIGKQQYFEENNIGIAQVIVLSTVIFIILLFFIYHKFSKNKKIHEKEKNDLSEKNNISQKLILDLEHEIKRLKRALEDGEKNEVSNLLKSLKSERELRIQKIGGSDEK